MYANDNNEGRPSPSPTMINIRTKNPVDFNKNYLLVNHKYINVQQSSHSSRRKKKK